MAFKSSQWTFPLQAFYARQIRLKDIMVAAVRPGFTGIGGTEERKHGLIHGGGNMNGTAVIADNEFTPAYCLNQFADACFAGQ